MAAQKYSESIPVFQQAISKDQNNASAFIGMGIAYIHTGRYNIAQAAMTEAKKLQPNKKELDEVLAWIEKKLAAEAAPSAMPHTAAASESGKPKAASMMPNATPAIAPPATATQEGAKP
jgi:thioredoxin-like negative regulator of GroEL